MQGGTLTKVELWASLLTILAHALFAINFAHEKAAAKDPNEIGGESLATVMRLAAFATLCFGLFLACG